MSITIDAGSPYEQKIEIPASEVQSVICPVGYWRKASAIHGWFVDNVQEGNDNCGTFYVSLEKMIELRNLCQQVLADHSLAPDLLRVSEGFFFGSSEYDEGYFDDVQHTLDMLNPIIEKEEKEEDENSYYYTSSW